MHFRFWTYASYVSIRGELLHLQWRCGFQLDAAAGRRPRSWVSNEFQKLLGPQG